MYRKYMRRNAITLMKPYVEGEPLPDGCSVGAYDKRDGSPKVGDMIAQNRNDPSDTWLVAKEYFESNYFLEPIESD